MLIYRIRGAIFFGAVSAVAAALERISDGYRMLVLDFSAVTLVDSSAANMIAGLARKARRRGIAIWVTGTSPALRRELLSHGVRPPLARFASSVEAALERSGRTEITGAAPAEPTEDS